MTDEAGAEPTESHEAAERFALSLSQYGLQRMTARVMAALLFTQRETMTAGDVSEQLAVSTGAVSGALKNLIVLGMIEKTPAPGSRRDHYRFRDDAWSTLMSAQNVGITAMTDAADQGVKTVGADTPAGRRLVDMREFYAYLLEELPAIVDRWHERRGRS